MHSTKDDFENLKGFFKKLYWNNHSMTGYFSFIQQIEVKIIERLLKTEVLICIRTIIKQKKTKQQKAGWENG